MKYFNLLIRILLVGIIWTCFYAIIGRTLIYAVWGFDPAYNRHWVFLWQMWKDGWVIDTTPEWIFLFVILLFVPVWLLGWLLLSRVQWGAILWNFLKYPLVLLKKFYDRRLRNRTLVIVRRKSYRRVRPNPLPYFIPSSTARAKPKKHKKRKDGKDADKMFEKIDELSGQKKKSRDAEYMPDEADFAAKKADSEKEESGLSKKEILESLHRAEENNEDNIADSPEEDGRRFAEVPAWDVSKEETIKPSEVAMTPEEEAALKSKAYEDSRDMLKVKGFKVLENAEIGGVKIDLIGLAKGSVLLCKFDDVKGDWLADEETVNGEAPSWFFEDVHRESPAFQLTQAERTFKEVMKTGEKVEFANVLAIESGNVINAPDMEETWNEKNIIICRLGMGKPVSLPHFVEAIPEADAPADKAFVDRCKKAFKIG